MPSGSHFRRSLKRWFAGKPAWLDSLDPRILLVFVHIPKAAGTSFNGLLEKVYGSSFLNVSNHHRAWEARRPNPAGIRCLSGHVPYGWHRKLGGKDRQAWPTDGLFADREILYVSIVRDPVERFQSYFRYAKQAPKHRHHREVSSLGPRQFLEYLDRIGDRGAWDQQFRMLGGMPGERFHLVAPLEKLETFVGVLGKSLNWPAEIQIPRENVSRREVRDDFDSSLLEEIEARGARDRELYRNVCERFAREDFPAFRW